MDMKLLLDAVKKTVAGIILIGVLLFRPAGTMKYWNGWLFCAVLFIPVVIMGVVLFLKAPDLLRKRLQEKEEQAEQKKELYYNYKTNLNSLIAHCQLLYDYNSRLIPKVNSITELENKQDKAAQDVLTTKTFVKNTEKEIKKVQKEKNSFILDNEICPCCGQQIDKSHVSTITNFMEGNNG